MAQAVDKPEAQRYMGGGILRKEDPELLTGQARYIDDIKMPGVVAVYSGQDFADDFADGLPCAWPVTEDIKLPKHWPVARDKARYAGDAVGVVVADSRERAKDALEAVDVDYEPLDAVVGIERALEDRAPLVHDEFDSNSCYTWTLAQGEVDRVFSEAPVVVTERYFHPRLIPNAIEPRGVVVQPIAAMG